MSTLTTVPEDATEARRNFQVGLLDGRFAELEQFAEQFSLTRAQAAGYLICRGLDLEKAQEKALWPLVSVEPEVE